MKRIPKSIMILADAVQLCILSLQNNDNYFSFIELERFVRPMLIKEKYLGAKFHYGAYKVCIIYENWCIKISDGDEIADEMASYHMMLDDSETSKYVHPTIRYSANILIQEKVRFGINYDLVRDISYIFSCRGWSDVYEYNMGYTNTKRHPIVFDFGGFANSPLSNSNARHSDEYHYRMRSWNSYV